MSVVMHYFFTPYKNGLSCTNSLSKLDVFPVPLYILTSKDWPITHHTPDKARQGLSDLLITYTKDSSTFKSVIKIWNRLVWSEMVCFGVSTDINYINYNNDNDHNDDNKSLKIGGLLRFISYYIIILWQESEDNKQWHLLSHSPVLGTLNTCTVKSWCWGTEHSETAVSAVVVGWNCLWTAHTLCPSWRDVMIQAGPTSPTLSPGSIPEACKHMVLSSGLL